MGNEVERYEVKSQELEVQYAGFELAENLTAEEKVVSLLSLIPMALQVVDEARDTIERLRDENERLRKGTETDGREDLGVDCRTAQHPPGQGTS